ncbi:hypothetical protein CerSpe_215100 [Prunus speciosa]
MNFAVCFLLGIAFVTAEAQQMQSNLSRGSSLSPTTNSSWLSSPGLYAFGFYKQGNGYAVGIFLAGMPQHTVVWTANRDDPPISSNSESRKREKEDRRLKDLRANILPWDYLHKQILPCSSQATGLSCH